MPQDAFTLRYLCEELNNVFKGGKVNRITEPSIDELLLTVYTGKKTEKLLLNVNPASPRIGVTHEERESPLTAPNFCMLMRKHLLSATIESISLVGFDRIVKIDLMASAEFFDAVKKTVYVELMGRYSNIILTENGKILGGNRGINMFDNGVRPLIVGQPYVFPPVGEKLLPNDERLLDAFKETESGIAEKITKNVQGIALITAKEIEKRFIEKFGENYDTENLFDFMNAFLLSQKKNPCVVIDNNEVKDVLAFPYGVISSELKYFNELYSAEEYYFNERDKLKKFTSKKERLNSVTSTAIKKVKKRLTAITAKEKDASSSEENRIKGELLLSNIYRLKQGQTECELENYYDGSIVKISLDSRLSISKNAENYYKRYNKQKRTIEALKPQREQAENELDYLTSIIDELAIAESIEDLDFIQTELENAGLIQARNNIKKIKKETFCREYEVYGFTVRAGRNNSENDKLTFGSSSNDVWIHVKDYHSSHVVIESANRQVPEKVIVIASQICAYYSKGRDGGKVEVVYTLKKNVKKPPRSKPGFCTYDNFKSVVVDAEKHAEFLKTT